MKNLQMLDGDEIQYSESFHQLEKPLMDLVAETSIWVNPAKVSKDPVYPNIRRGRAKDKGKIEDGVRIDDNTYANKALKTAISKDIDIANYTVCHIWPGTAYDQRYHTQLANLVLIPRVIAGLSDFCKKVVEMLKYRAYELYGWFPEEETAPEKPEYYPEKWGEFIKEELTVVNGDNDIENIIDIEDYLSDIGEYYTEETDLEYYNNNREEIEIDKVRRKVPKWIRCPHQINSTILNSYMELSRNGILPVAVSDLQDLCKNRGVEKFIGHYNQMKNFGLRNHAKVFEQSKYSGKIFLWPEVATYIKGLYKKR